MDTALFDFSFGDFGPVADLALCNPHFGDFWPLLPDDGNMLLVFRGVNRLEDIDYTEIVAARLGTGDVAIDSPPHVLETNYFYAARQVSIYGRVEHNMTVVEKFRLASDGEPESDRPDHITALTAEAAAGGEIKLKFSHRKIDGTTPVRFNAYYDGGLGPGYIGDDGAVDPDCVLLLHFDGDDGDTTVTDSSGSGHTVTASGDFELDDSIKKFGNTSGKLSNVDYASIDDHSDFSFGTDDLTIMCHFRIDDIKSGKIADFFHKDGDGTHYISLYYSEDPDTGSEFYFKAYNGAASLVMSYDGTQVEAATWYHLCVVRSGNDWKLYLDGVIVDSENNNISLPDTVAQLHFLGCNDFVWWFDDLVVTKKALYTEAFDVPTRSYGACLGEVDYRGDGNYVFTTEVLTDGTRYHFAVTAEDTDGNVDRFNRVVSAVADSSVPDALTGIETSVVF